MKRPKARSTFGGVAKAATGIFYAGSMIKIADVTDGTSNTYLCGEKCLNPDYYTTGQDGGDNESALTGDNMDIVRWAALQYMISPPYYGALPDTPGVPDCDLFGSAHLNGFQMAFCDGSVQMMNYSIDSETHRRLADRKDGLPIDAKKW